MQLVIKRDQQHQAECIRPQIAQAIRPNALFTHPAQFRQNIFDLMQWYSDPRLIRRVRSRADQSRQANGDTLNSH